MSRGLRGRGWHVEIAETTISDGGARIAAEGMAAGFEALVACGGDGTVHEIVNAVAAAGAEAAPVLAIAPPWGTANILALALGVPNAADAAAAWLARARPQRFPLGVVETAAETRRFAAVASAGYDAAVVHALSAQEKRRWGKAAFAWKAATIWRRYFPAPLEFEADGVRGSADGIIWGLTQYYGGRLRLGAANPGRGIALALRGMPGTLPWQGMALLTRGLEQARGVERLKASAIAITTPGIPLELDGEASGATPARLRCEPRAIRILSAGVS